MSTFMSQEGFLALSQDEDLMKGSLIWTFGSCFFYCKVIIKIQNNPIWQICFQKASLSFSIITEKYSLIVLTPVERFDRGPDVLPCRRSDSEASTICFRENVRLSKAPLGMLLFFPYMLKNWRGWNPNADERQLCKCKFVMHLGEGPFINVTLELQVVVCFGQGSNGLRIILHLVLRSLFNKSVQDVLFIQREALGQLRAYCI